MSEATRLLNALEPPEDGSTEKLLPLIYDELRRLAAYRLAHEYPGQTLQATALVHEAYLRLVQAGCDQWEDSRHFFNAVAEAMRRILIDSARRKQRPKHGGGLDRIGLEQIEVAEPLPSDDLLALDEALGLLAKRDPQAAELVQLRFFVGLTQQQAAGVLGISRRTADRTWAYTRAWLFQQVASSRESGP